MSAPTRPHTIPAHSASSFPEQGRAWLLLLVTVLAYLPALQAGYIWDDDDYLTDNSLLGSVAGLLDIWVPGNTPQYYPIVFTTFWIEHALWGLEPMGYHVVNVVLHACNALLLWRLARRLGIPGAGILATLFALHPVHVESVAWVTERKNVLSASFYFLSFGAYLSFADARERGAGRTGGWYAWALVAFSMALFSKTVTCSLPAAMVLVHLWRGERPDLRRLAPLLPFLLLGLGLGLHTAYLERTQVGATGEEFAFSALERIAIASRGLCFYPAKLLWPDPLLFIYPRWNVSGLLGMDSLLCLTAVLTAGGVGLLLYRRGQRGPLLALCYFAGTLFPALGFFSVWPMRYSFVADHFQYLASIGILMLLAAGLDRGIRRWDRTRVVLVALFALLGWRTWQQTRIYENEERLWEETLAGNPGAWIAHNNLATMASQRGNFDGALEHLRRARELPQSDGPVDQVDYNIGLTLEKQGRFEEALAIFQGLRGKRRGATRKAASNLERLGRQGEADALWQEGLASDEREGLLFPYGVSLLRRGRAGEAAELLAEAHEAAPDSVDVLMFQADALEAAGRRDEARASVERALVLSEQSRDAELRRAVAARLRQLRGF